MTSRSYKYFRLRRSIANKLPIPNFIKGGNHISFPAIVGKYGAEELLSRWVSFETKDSFDIRKHASADNCLHPTIVGFNSNGEPMYGYYIDSNDCIIGERSSPNHAARHTDEFKKIFCEALEQAQRNIKEVHGDALNQIAKNTIASIRGISLP